MFVNNKYKKWHDSIIDRAKNRVLSCYVERHHIIPKSCGGSDDKFNLVSLTPREHFIVHLLLTKILKGNNKAKMILAFNFMCDLKKKNSRLFDNLRSKGLKILSKKLTGRKIPKETKDKIKYARQFQVCSDEQRKNYSKIYSNLIWVNFNGKSKRIKKELKQQYLNKGYKLGRDMSYMTIKTRNLLSQKTKAYWENRRAS
jgi:hypothetical protein